MGSSTKDDGFVAGSRFATVAEVFTERFREVNEVMSALNREFQLADHTDLNGQFFPWSAGLYGVPRIYASRLWEFPYAVLSAGLVPGMSCADVGCGRTPFTPYLAREARCEVTGFDPDVFEAGERHKAFGVDGDFIRRTGLRILKCGMERLEVPDNSFDRVFCLSVIEHVEEATARRGIREMVRILKPGGLLVMTMDVEIFSTFCEADPLSLVWESGLMPQGRLDLEWPRRRFCRSYRGGRAADVFGLVLAKRDYRVERNYLDEGVTDGDLVEGWRIPQLRAPKWRPLPVLPWNRRLRKIYSMLRHGVCPEEPKS